jgi:hypothetical protein
VYYFQRTAATATTRKPSAIIEGKEREKERKKDDGLTDGPTFTVGLAIDASGLATACVWDGG